jgi:purine-cytosine permease-like protein
LSEKSPTTEHSPAAPPPPLTEVESHGVERIPDADRTATPLDLFRLAFGGANTFSTCVLGAFPILFGLSFWQGLAATLLGVVAGALILCPMAVFGPVNGTNNAVSSSAHLGVHGRVVGSFLSLLTAVAFFSISVWSSGDALVGGAHRLFGLERSTPSYVVAYTLFAVLVLAVCVYGFRFMLFVNKVAVTSASLLFLLGAIAFAGDFDPSYAGVFTDSAGAATRSLFWPSFIGAALIVLSNPVSFGAFLGDWSRYIPASTPRRKVIGAAFLSQIATLLPFLFGLSTASIIAAKAPEYVDPAAPDFVGGLLAISPSWFFLPVCLLALIGGLSTGTTSLYGTGLDFSSVFPRLSRVRATVLVGVLSIGFIFVGRFGLDLVRSISTFATMIITCTTPWMVVMILGFWTRRGWYDPEALQVFNRRQRGGRYWFAHGWNWRGMTAWWVSALLGVLFTNIPGQFVGPLGDLAGGVDISLPLSLVVSAVLFLTLLRLFPEPRAVYGPDGARLVRTADVPVPPITGPGAPADTAPVLAVDGSCGVVWGPAGARRAGPRHPFRARADGSRLVARFPSPRTSEARAARTTTHHRHPPTGPLTIGTRTHSPRPVRTSGSRRDVRGGTGSEREVSVSVVVSSPTDRMEPPCSASGEAPGLGEPDFSAPGAGETSSASGSSETGSLSGVGASEPETEKDSGLAVTPSVSQRCLVELSRTLTTTSASVSVMTGAMASPSLHRGSNSPCTVKS